MRVERLAGEAADARGVGDALMEHAPSLLAAGRAMTLNDAEAYDLMQTTFEIALRRADQLRDPAALRGWLLTIQAREAFRLTRRLRRFVRFDPAVTDVVSRGADETDRIAVTAALRRLPARTRAAVVLHHMSGLSVRETAAALGVTDAGAKWHLKTGLARLREVLGDD